jgi:predicted Zn finger-like uncharacterized protein
MKITCESCSAQYDLDDNRIPPSGLTMKCPACLHSFTVKKDASPPAARASGGISLSDLSQFTGSDDPELPAPVRKDDPPDLPGPRLAEIEDLPAPRVQKTISRMAPVPRPAVLKTPAPPAELEPLNLDDDLPAPALPKGLTDLPAPARPKGVVDLPAPAAPKGVMDLPAPATPKGVADLPAPARPKVADLPAPVTKRREPPDLKAPKTAAYVPPPLDLDAPDLLTPKSVGVGIGLDAPEADDLLEPVGKPLADRSAAPPIDLDQIDVVAPKDATTDLEPKVTDLEPKLAVTDLAPKLEVMDVTPQTMDVRPLDKPAPPPAEARPAEVPAVADPSAPPVFVPDPEPRRFSRGLIFGGGALLLVGALGVSLGLFTSSGFFGVNLITGRHAESDAKIATARKLFAEDTLASYRRAANDLHQLVEADPSDAAVAALEAQSRLCAARLGITAEIKNADKLLGPFDAMEKVGALPDVQKARALRSLVGGKPVEARIKLQAVLQAAPADASALVYLGWTELASGETAAAELAFNKAVAAESNRAAAIYGLGVARELKGDRAGAKTAYEKTLAKSGGHFGAQVAMARIGDVKDREQRIQELIDKRAASVGPKEAAEAWAALGALAVAAGRREEAEDRLQRSLALDPDSAVAQVNLARVHCDLSRAAEAVAPLRKLLLTQPKNLDARLGLTRALLEGKPDKYFADAVSTLAPAIKDFPKDARVLYWQGRLALGADKPDKDAAYAKFKAAREADPKLLQAYLAESAVLSQLGRSDDAVDILKQAAAKASDDTSLQTELGAAYLSLGKPAEAETQLRAALEKQPELYEARMYLGGALEAQSRLDEAGAAYDAVAQKSPKYPGLRERQGRLAARRGNKEEASKLFSQALGEGVPTASLRLAAAEVALEVGKPEDAQHLAELVVKDDDRSATAHLLLARAQLARNKPEEALPEARRAAMLSDSPESHLAVGRALELMSKLDQSVSEYQLARRGNAEAEATLGRARIMVRMGATKDALSELQALVRDNKLRAQALVLMGDCYSDLQQRDKARSSYEDAVKAGPTLAEASFKFGRSLHDAGKRKPAIEMLTRSLKDGGDQTPSAAESYLLLGDSNRELHQNAEAVKAYKRFLDLAPPDSPSRPEVQKHVSILGGP